MSKVFSLTLDTQAERSAVASANYLAGVATAAPVFKTAKAVAQAACLSIKAGGLASDTVARFAGGARAMALVAALVASRTVKELDGKAWLSVSGWLKGQGLEFSKEANPNSAAFAEVGRVFKHLSQSFTPAAAHNAGTVAGEALALVREALAKAGTWGDLLKSAPTTSKAGRKSKAKGEAEGDEGVTDDESPMTAHEAGKRLQGLLAVLRDLIREDDAEAADVARAHAKAMADLVAAITPKAKRAPRIVKKAA